MATATSMVPYGCDCAQKDVPKVCTCGGRVFMGGMDEYALNRHTMVTTSFHLCQNCDKTWHAYTGRYSR